MKLSNSSYGKGSVRVKKVIKHPDFHDLKDFMVTVLIEGDFTEAHLSGDNREVLPTDTQRNTIYLIAKQHDLESIESYALALSKHLIDSSTQFTAVEVQVTRYLWERLPVDFIIHPTSYKRAGQEEWTCRVKRTKDQVQVISGIQNCEILKTTDSGFSDFKRDDWTTLKDTDDRMLCTRLTAEWTYESELTDFVKNRSLVQTALLNTFANHKSLSVQHTLYAMGESALKSCNAISKINLEMPNIHNLLFNMEPFGLENDNEIYHVTSEPFGIIKGEVSRT